MILLLAVIAVALIFEFINGFHDTANSIATVVGTKVLTPGRAILLAAVTNLLGAMWGTAVAKTIASGIVKTEGISPDILLAALGGAIIWNLITWWWGLPSSSSHALVGGLVGATLSATHHDFNMIIWSNTDKEYWFQYEGILWKIILPMIASPIAGFLVGVMTLGVLYRYIQWTNTNFRRINKTFARLQIASAALMGFMHGTNDAQKTMGIIFLAIVSMQPHLLSNTTDIPLWIKVLCSVTMAAGTAGGGWRIIRTIGERITHLRPIQGFAAEASASLILHVASTAGIPVSTTHTVTTAVLGVGAAKKGNKVQWNTVYRILMAWIFTLPAAAVMGYLLEMSWRLANKQ